MQKKMSENSLKDIISRNPQIWMPIFKKHMTFEETPNFSVYRKPLEDSDKSKFYF